MSSLLSRWRPILAALALALSSACSRPQADGPKIVSDPATAAPLGPATVPAKGPASAPSAPTPSPSTSSAPSPKTAELACAANADCALDPSSGTCRAGKGPRKVEGGQTFCACLDAACTPQVVPPVACKSTADCSWLEAPWRPAPASAVPRPHPPVLPCKTGERDVVCDAGTCVLRAWKC